MIMPVCRKQESKKQESKKDTIYSKEYYNQPLFINNEERIEFVKYGLILVGVFVIIIYVGCLLEKYKSKK